METFNPMSTSGAPLMLEHYVQAAYLVSLLVQTPIAFGEELVVTELYFQGKHRADTDDLIACMEGRGRKLTCYLQSKLGFEIGANQTFFEVMEGMWKDYNRAGADKETCKFIITTGVLSRPDREDGLLVLEWARYSKDSKDFLSKLRKNKRKYVKFNYFRDAIERASGGAADDNTIWKLLSDLYILTYDYLDAGSKDKEVLKWYMKPFLAKGRDPQRVLDSLLQYVFVCNQHGSSLTRASVADTIKDLFDLVQSPVISRELQELLKKGRSLVQHTINSTIEGVHIEREDALLRLSETLAERSFVIINGEGGVGKSALARDYLERVCQDQAGYLAIKADLLDRSSLAHTLSDMGASSDLVTLLAQWLLLPTRIIYIDSFEKLYETDRKEAFLELLAKIQAIAGVKVIVTCHTFAVDTLRLKFRLPAETVGEVPLTPFTEKEISAVVVQKPFLQSIATSPQLRELIAIPFYLNLACQIAGVITGDTGMDPSTFKAKLWEYVIEKKGSGPIGVGLKRAAVFTSVVIRRARAKLPFISPDASEDLNILAELEKDRLLFKSLTAVAFCPAHDIFEDMVVVRYLDGLFEQKISSVQFLTALDRSPVIRRGLRIWIGELIKQEPAEAAIFLTEVLGADLPEETMTDELLLGMLGGPHAVELLNKNAAIMLASNCRYFSRVFHLCKLAFAMDYQGAHPERRLKTVGPSWSALLLFMDTHYDQGQRYFDVMAPDILYHWSLQFEPDDPLPPESSRVAGWCWRLLREGSDGQPFNPPKKIREILFLVAPFCDNQIDALLQAALQASKESKKNGGRWHAYDDLIEMILVDTFRCAPLYKLFPDLVIEIAKLEWYREEFPDELDGDYMEASFGLQSEPYKYFNASSYQTPFRYLFRYHPEKALLFLSELCNRGMNFYLRSAYAGQANTRRITLRLQDGTELQQWGDAGLWQTYRGGVAAPPYLVQSALMAFEEHMLEMAATGSLSPDYVEKVLRNNESILLTAVIAAVAMAYPLAFKEQVFILLNVKELYQWDLSRYANELHAADTAMGIEPYFSRERIVSNEAKHRRSSLEDLLVKLQFFYADRSFAILDRFKSEAADKDMVWKLALVRMDLRNTRREDKKDEGVIIFTPEPLSEELQQFVEEGAAERKIDMAASNVFLWTNNVFKGRVLQSPTYEEWKEEYLLLREIDFSQVRFIADPSKSFAAIGIRDFWASLTQEERKFCAQTYTAGLLDTLHQLRSDDVYLSRDTFNESAYTVLPLLLHRSADGLVNGLDLRGVIEELLLLLHPDAKKHLVQGMRTYGWDIDPVFGKRCFELLLKLSKQAGFRSRLRQLRYRDNRQEDSYADIAADKALSATSVAAIDLESDDLHLILEAFQLIPYQVLNREYATGLSALMDKMGAVTDWRRLELIDFKRQMQHLLANYFLNNTDEQASLTFVKLLSLAKPQTGLVMDTLKQLIYIGHDSIYPPALWFHLHVLYEYCVQESPFVAFAHILLLEPLKSVKRCHQLPASGPSMEMHKNLLSFLQPSFYVIEAEFKLLAGVGRGYQPICLTWLMQQFKDKSSYLDNLVAVPITYLELFVEQLYKRHLKYIQRNAPLMEYFLLLLSVLIDRGSRLAFRIRDEII